MKGRVGLGVQRESHPLLLVAVGLAGEAADAAVVVLPPVWRRLGPLRLEKRKWLVSPLGLVIRQPCVGWPNFGRKWPRARFPGFHVNCRTNARTVPQGTVGGGIGGPKMKLAAPLLGRPVPRLVGVSLVEVP